MPNLEPYQLTGADFLAARRYAYLADAMRLGKTPQFIRACDAVGAKDVVVASPAVGIWNWAKQFEEWQTVQRPIQVLANGRDYPGDGGVIIGSYDILKRHALDLPRADVLGADESHLIKSLDAHRTKLILGRGGLIHRADRTWFLSGTPSPNGDPREMWPVLFVCGITRLDYEQFQRRYTKGFNTPHGFKVTGLRNVEELRGLLSEFMLRRKWEDVMTDLPQLTTETIYVPPSEVDVEVWFFDWWIKDKGESLKREVERESLALDALLNTAERDRAPARTFASGLESLAVSMTTLRRYIAVQKVPAVVEMVKKELENNEYDKLVIFCVHRDPIELLRQSLAKFKPVTLYGGTPPETRRANLEKFRRNPKCRVFIGNIQAAGTNVDLTSAKNILFLEQSWVPGDNAQAMMRCHNIYQKAGVHVRYVALPNHIDERVTNVLRKKSKSLIDLLD